MEDERYRNIAIVVEMNSCMKYLKKGLAEIQIISANNDFYEPVFLYLSSGFERLFKVMLCLNFKEKNGRFPELKELMQGNSGHDVEFLKKTVETICIPVSQHSANKDYEIITSDKIINQICKTLSEFGKKARYFNLNIVLGTQQEFNPKKEWGQIENELLIDFYGEKEFHKKLSSKNQLEELFKKSNQLIICRLELFLRAITRQFIFGNFSKESKTFIIDIKAFSGIEDNEIGKRNYTDNHV